MRRGARWVAGIVFDHIRWVEARALGGEGVTEHRRVAVDRRRLIWLIANWCSHNKKCFTCQFRASYRRTRREVFPHS